MSAICSAAGRLVDGIRINELRREVRSGRALWVKRRAAASAAIIGVANGFFRLAGNPVVVLGNLQEWRRWEVLCFRELHGGEYGAFADGARTVCADEVPGESLSRHLEKGTLTEDMCAAAGRELRRAHEWRCAEFGAAWSHGDPHTGNFIYEPGSNRARLIDFEVRHHRELPEEERHAEDLLVFLQDMMGRIGAADWLPCAKAFLAGYDRAEISRFLRDRLVAPSGVARIWWAVRTTYLDGRERSRRINQLRSALA